MSSSQHSVAPRGATSQTRLAKIADALSQFIHLSALVFCWSGGLLVAAILFNVIMRYGFDQGLIIFEEIQWHLYAVGMMFGLSYAEITDSQVRVEVVSDNLRRQTMRKWEIFGALVFVYPFIYVVMINGFEYVSDSYRVNESSNSPLGLPYRWAIKAVIPISFALLAIAVTSRLLRNIDALLTKSDGDQ
ncbi:MAG: TRAP-type mannitol/chloroaromatic compound transport system permease small subunit [Candidatus Endobugula sp.]|jgi:TRAP-type mannitol/chloroaromatic compound transport system permease small subunit